MSDVLIVELFTFLAVVVGFVYQAYRDNRKRKWDVEDRAMLARTVVTTAAKLADQSVIDNSILNEAIQANTDISTKAFHEANSVNMKIESLGIEHNALQKREQDSNKESGVITDIVSDTQERVKNIESEILGSNE